MGRAIIGSVNPDLSQHRTHHRLARRSRGKLIAGVASGLGDDFGIEPNLVRLAFVVLAFAGGAGIVLYVAGWIWIPRDDADGAPPVASTRRRSRSDWVQVAALGAVTLGILLLSQRIGLGLSDALVWPVVLAAMGAALIVGRSGKPIDEVIGELVGRGRSAGVRPTPRGRRTRPRSHGSDSAARSWSAGVGAFLASHNAFNAIGQGLLAVAVLLGGLALIFGPWLWRLWNALVEERSERIRSDERGGDGRAPARLRAPDPRHDPAPRRRPARGRGPRAAARSASCGRGCSAGRRSTPTSTSPTRSKTRPPTSSSATASRSTSCASAARARSTTGCVRSCRRPGRRW